MAAYITHMLVFVGIYAIVTMGQNIILGYTGLFGIAQAAFYGIGAYTSAILAVKLGLPFWVGLAAGAMLAGIFGWLLGLATMRLGGDYFCIVTLGFVVIIQQVFLNWESLTRGAFGIPAIPRPILFGYAFDSRLSYCILVWILVAVLSLLMNNIAVSRVGRAFFAVRDNETAALSMGINTFEVKVSAVGLGATYAGVGGVLFAHYTGYIDPSSFSILETIIVLCMAVLGGMGSITGSILGAGVLLFIPEMLRLVGVTGSLSIYRQLLYGVLLVAAILVRPKGIMGMAELRIQALYKGGSFTRLVGEEDVYVLDSTGDRNQKKFRWRFGFGRSRSGH